MRCYVQTRFSSSTPHGIQALKMYHRAVTLVERVPVELGEHVRCHELARAVGKILGLPYQDGRFEAVEHTWLWALPGWEFRAEGRNDPGAPPPVLDVYVPGALPQVQLVDWEYWGLPYKRIYVPGPERDDIDMALVRTLVGEMVPHEG